MGGGCNDTSPSAGFPEQGVVAYVCAPVCHTRTKPHNTVIAYWLLLIPPLMHTAPMFNELDVV